jgi:type VI secretion system protein ImpK
MSQLTPRTNSLGYSFQEVFTAILRIRSNRQQVQNSETFRGQIRRSLQSAMLEARNLGYSNETVQMAVFAAVGYLDETVLNLQSPSFADWARRPLQEELFGGHMAGELFFSNLRDLLNKQDSAEVADTLEVYCLCLELGYKGRYALGGGGELQSSLQQARQKIARIRGNASFLPMSPAPDIRTQTRQDPWSRRLGWSAAVMAVVVILTFVGLEVSLANGVSQVQNTGLSEQ